MKVFYGRYYSYQTQVPNMGARMYIIVFFFIQIALIVCYYYDVIVWKNVYVSKSIVYVSVKLKSRIRDLQRFIRAGDRQCYVGISNNNYYCG